MRGALCEFAAVTGHDGVWCAQTRSLRCTALRLRDGSICLYSPVAGLKPATRDSLTALGPVTFLLAPNHYHNKGLAEYAAAFPDAALVCSGRAQPRLEQQTGLSFDSVQTLERMLPDDCEILTPEGLKNGEVWLAMRSERALAWILCDAFTGSAGNADGIATQIEQLRTFPRYGIADEPAYSAWVQAALSRQAPGLIIPCHGSIVRSDTLAQDITSLLR